MSPRGNSSTSANTRATPYSRRPASQPKSSRQQFSACGACRMRRVRCDLKDLPMGTTAPHPACSNCKERGIKCVDEFADVKAVKLLRRGRRLQQVEAIYGKVMDGDGGTSFTNLPSGRMPSVIPELQIEFFSSSFWHWFAVHRPVLDSTEFPARFLAHTQGINPLKNEGGLIAMLLVIYAASFGLDERGQQADSYSGLSSSTTLLTKSIIIKREDSGSGEPMNSRNIISSRRNERKARTDAMLKEVLELVDLYGVLRRPTLDGVRALLLLLPLMEESQPLERLVIHEAALSQVHVICTSETTAGTSPSLIHGMDDTSVRARIFWYAYTQEGILTGMKGARFVLHGDDLNSFQRTLPPMTYNAGNSNLSSPASPSSLEPQVSTSQVLGRGLSRSFLQLANTSSLPLQLSTVCRKVHTVLTGMKATRRADEHGLIDAHGMRGIWRDLDHCWSEFDKLKQLLIDEDPSHHQHTEQFITGWQILIFECHNIIRESLKQYMTSTPTQALYSNATSSRPSSHSSGSSPYLPPHHLHAIAVKKCMGLLPHIVRLIESFVATEGSDAGLFRYDTGLVRDGCFFAAYLAASMETDLLNVPSDEKHYNKLTSKDDISVSLTAEESVSICLTALSSMQWAFSRSEEREETVRMVWENRKLIRQENHFESHRPTFHAEYAPPNVHHVQAAAYEPRSLQHVDLHAPPLSTSAIYDRPSLPPLTLFDSNRRPESAPATACTIDSAGGSGWPSYTPPGTGSTTSTGTGMSTRDSPIFNSLASYKGHPNDTFYHATGDLEQFSFNAPLSNPLVRDSPDLSTLPVYTHRSSPVDAQALRDLPSTHYLSSGIYTGTHVLGHVESDFNGCPQFGENCSGAYH